MAGVENNNNVLPVDNPEARNAILFRFMKTFLEKFGTRTPDPPPNQNNYNTKIDEIYSLLNQYVDLKSEDDIDAIINDLTTEHSEWSNGYLGLLDYLKCITGLLDPLYERNYEDGHENFVMALIKKSNLTLIGFQNYVTSLTTPSMSYCRTSRGGIPKSKRHKYSKRRIIKRSKTKRTRNRKTRIKRNKKSRSKTKNKRRKR